MLAANKALTALLSTANIVANYITVPWGKAGALLKATMQLLS